MAHFCCSRNSECMFEQGDIELPRFSLNVSIPPPLDIATASVLVMSSPSESGPDLCNNEFTYVVYVDSRAYLNSQIPSLLRNKYNMQLITFPNMPFFYVIGHSLCIEIIKFSELTKDGVCIKLLRKIYKYQRVYHKIYVIIQQDEKDALDLTPHRLKLLHSLYTCAPLEKIEVYFSCSQEKSALIISNLVMALDPQWLISVDATSFKIAKLLKAASLISSLGVVSPSVAVELLMKAGSFRDLVNNGSPSQLTLWSKNVNAYQAQLLFRYFTHHIVPTKN